MHTASTIARLGLEELAHRAKRGELNLSTLWMGVRGAERYVEAVARGDFADEPTATDRADICAACPHRTTTPSGVTLDDGTVIQAKHWCGPALTDRTTQTEPTCGCLVALTIGGRLTPAGKPWVASERCPQERWVKSDAPQGNVGQR